MTSTVLSDSMVYTPRPNAVLGSKNRQNVPCYNQSVARPGSVIMFNIPCSRKGQYLSTRSSFLKLKVNNRSTAQAHVLDFSAHRLISRLEVYHGSNLLEQISEYGVLATMLKDLQTGSDEFSTVASVLEGCDTPSLRSGTSITTGTSRIFCLQLLSGVIGGLQSRYLPTGEMVGDLRLELTLADVNEPFVVGGTTAADAANWDVSEMELILEYVELDSQAAMMISQQNPNGYMFSVDSFAHYASTIPANTQQVNILIPARFSVLKSLFSVVRKDADVSDKTKKSISGRENPISDSGEYYFSIGGKNFPATPVKSDTEALAEALKSIHTLGSSSSPSLISRSNWTATTEGAYLMATDLERYHGKSSLASNGVSTLSVNSHLIARLRANNLSAQRVDTWAHHESLLMIVNGIASVQI